MPASKALLATTISLAVFCCFGCPPSMSKTRAITGQSEKAKTTRKEWVLEQRQNFPVIVYLSMDAVKIVAPDVCLQIIAQAPDWKVHCINTSTKSEWIGDMSEFNGVCLNNPFAVPSLKGSDGFRPAGCVKMGGLNCVKYQRGAPRDTTICTASEIEVNDKCSELLYRYYFLRRLPNVPVYAMTDRREFPGFHKEWADTQSMQDLRNGIVISLSTKSCREKPFDAADFAVPQHCHRQANLVSVGYTKKSTNDMTEMLDSIGFSSDDRIHGEADQKHANSKPAK